MTQDIRYIDLNRSYIPGDPNAFPSQLQAAQAGSEEAGGRVPIMIYDGYNFLPTPQGYSSFFGTNTALGINSLVGNVDEVFVIQTNTFVNKAVALKDDGIWTKDLSSGGAWTQEIVLAVPGTHRNWSKCVIDQVIYVYRQAEASYWRADPGTGYVFTATIPTFLTMAAQLGIFKAGGRLGFWDSANSTAWSAFGNAQDFTPSVETLAGSSIFQDIVGRIVTVLQHGEGFIIYATRSIVHVQRDVNSPMLFRGKAIFENNGIAYREEVCFSDPDTQHFAMTTTGFCEIKEGIPEFAAHDFSRFLKEKREAVYLKLINGKFLFFHLLSADFLLQRTYFSDFFDEAPLVHWAAAKAAAWDTPSSDPMKALRQANWTREEIYLNRQLGYTNFFPNASGVGVVPIWRNFFHTSPSAVNLQAFKAAYDAGTAASFFTKYIIPGDPTPFNDFLGAPTPVTILQLLQNFDLNTAAFKTDFLNANKQIQQSTQENFYSKNEWLWDLEDKYMTYLKAALLTLNGDPHYFSRSYFTDDPASLYTLDVTDYSAHVHGVYVDCSRESECSLYYGLATKSSWAQRCFTKGFSWKNKRRRIRRIQISECKWYSTGSTFFFTGLNGNMPIFDSYTDIYASAGDSSAGQAIIRAAFALVYPSNPIVFTSVVDQGATSPVNNRSITFNINVYNAVGVFQATISYEYRPQSTSIGINTLSGNTDSLHGFPQAGQPVYFYDEVVEETFSVDIVDYDLPPGQFKTLSYTQIFGHGHYNAGPVFVVDNATTEAVDYTDVYTTGNFAEGQQPKFNNIIIDQTDDTIWHECGKFTQRDADTVINAMTFEGPCEPALELPPGSPVLLQAGSIEPVYPTFKACFVFDIHLKKWGKGVLDYKNMFDIYPVNNMAGEGIFPYENFMPKMGIRIADGTFPLLDEYPANSEVCFGKVGYYRKGFTDLEEVRFQHRNFRTGTLVVEPAITASKAPDSTYIESRTYTNAVEGIEGFSLSAHWYNIVFRGHYDLTHLEVRTVRAGKR